MARKYRDMSEDLQKLLLQVLGSAGLVSSEIMIEGVPGMSEIKSQIKRIFGENVRATSKKGMFDEVSRMLNFYSIILSI